MGLTRNLVATECVSTDVNTHEHFFLDKSDPGSWRAINAFSRKVAAANEEAEIPRSVTELLNVRVSQINGCAYCLNLHVRRASPISSWPFFLPGGTRRCSARWNVPR